ncbi:MAG: methylated-DNA--[protein]-cysteine S-methyltransferase [Spartobacteria bacterium]|nr:methylated-DNA--[protein]-cysteine S-methyltransferase [Spartobacteria bacterium]
MDKLILHTSWGRIEVVVRANRVASSHLARLERLPAVPFECRDAEWHIEDRQHTHLLKKVEPFVRKVLEGQGLLCDLPLAEQAATVFRKKVWAALMTIPCGSVATYGEVAAMIGAPRAARAVGQACGANPLPLFVPCHRVVAASDALGGFSAGTPWKEILLMRERGAGV